MIIYPQTFVVPMPATVTNSGRGRSRHWRAAHREKTLYWGTLDTLIGMCGTVGITLDGPRWVWIRIPRPPERPFERVSLRSVMHLGGAMDDDNALARHKPVIDWLKTRGYLADDRKKNIVWEGLPEQIVKRDGAYRIELTITPLPPLSASAHGRKDP